MDNAHDKHRQRMIDKAKKQGLSSFYDHELLEMLLYFAIPRGDTNPIGHALIDEFAGLTGILKADIKALETVSGIGPKSAVLINLVAEISRRNLFHENTGKNFKIQNTKQAVTYCKTLFIDKRYECLYAVCLDISGKVITDGFIAEGVVDQVPAYTRKVVETALKHAAHTVILAHNHPGGSPLPSDHDDIVTDNASMALSAIGIALNDHIIIGDTGYFSYASAGRIKREGIKGIIEASQKNVLLRNDILSPLE